MDAVRPSHCVECGAASRPVGGKLQIHGHGLREREVHGPGGPREEAGIRSVRARRLICLLCGAVMTVVPAEVLPWRRYSGAVIALVLGLWSLCGWGLEKLRSLCSTMTQWNCGEPGWQSVRRWALAGRAGRLWPCVPELPATWGARQVAERVSWIVAGCGPPGLASRDFAGALFEGAARAR